jgi:hypothetical protein
MRTLAFFTTTLPPFRAIARIVLFSNCFGMSVSSFRNSASPSMVIKLFLAIISLGCGDHVFAFPSDRFNGSDIKCH